MKYTGNIEQEICTLQAGALTLNCEFKWPEDVQEQYDKWMRMITEARNADPLVDNMGGRDAEYDYLSFYLDTDFETYEGPWPSSLLAASDKQERLKERIEQCTSLKHITDKLEELLRYTCVINGNTVIMVNTGGWYSGPEGATWRVRFTSPRERITRETLQYVTIEVDDGTS